MPPDPVRSLPRVLHFIYDDPLNPWVAGGGAARVREMYRRLGGRVDVEIITGAYPGSVDAEVDGVRYRRLGARTPYAVSRATYAAAANKLLRRAVFDVAVFDFSAYTPIFLPRDRPVGITVHHLTGPTARGRWGRIGARAIARLEREMLARARHFTATSRATYDELRQLLPREASVELVHAGVPDDLFGLEHEGGAGPLYFGRLDVYQKGLDTLVAAMALVARRKPGVKLRIAGRGKDAARVRALAEGAGISGSIEMMGPASEAERRTLLREATILVMPSRFEGFGMVAAEAMAAGVPVIAAAAGSLPEVVDPPRGGILVPPSDPESLADAIERLLGDDALRARIGATARESAQRFRWDRVADDHYQFLMRIRDAHRQNNPESHA